MKRVNLLLCIVLLGLANVAAATKVVVFDVQKAILDTDKAQAELKKFQERADIKQLAAQMESLQAEIRALNKDHETNGLTWSKEKIESTNRQVAHKQADLQLALKKLRTEQDALSSKISQEFLAKAQAAMKKVVQVEGIELVVSRQAAIDFNELVDITAKVTAEINKAK